MSKYLNSNNLLTESQSGFRPMFSTETALLEATNEWLWNIDNNLLNGVIFLDSKQKPFVTIWIRLSYWESVNSMGPVLDLLTGMVPVPSI